MPKVLNRTKDVVAPRLDQLLEAQDQALLPLPLRLELAGQHGA